MNYRFADTLTDADCKRHISHHFDVPRGCTHLSLRLNFTPARVDGIRNMLTFTLFDPNGFRGAGHRGGHEHLVEITADAATPGYWAGPLPAGQWTAQIDTHMILPGEPCRYELTISGEVSDAEAQGGEVHPLPEFDYVANPNPGWYRGDLHTHTIHSDASWDAAALLAAAQRAHLDFIALTDHNTNSGLAEFERLASPDLLTMGGMELTTFWGHAVCLGAHQWIDWRVDRAGEGMAQIAQQVYAANQLFIIAHPRDVGDPYCTGCRWLYAELMPTPARLVEVWNEAWSHPGRASRKNEDSLALYYHWLNQGHRLVATTGTDAHGPAHYERAPAFNVVYAEELSERGILNALAAGHLYLSAGPDLRFVAANSTGQTAMMGDALPVAPGNTPVNLRGQWMNCPADAILRLVVDGDVVHLHEVSGDGEMDWRLDDPGRWSLLELRGRDGKMLALTNPIFTDDTD